MENKRNSLILNEVERYFRFIFEMKYHIQRISYHPEEFGNWEVMLSSDRCLLEICKDRTEILIYFMPLSGDTNYRISLKAMIYFLSQGKEFLAPFKGNLFWGVKKQYEELAKLLKLYHDRIVPFFELEFNAHMKELLYAERNYFMEVVKIIK